MSEAVENFCPLTEFLDCQSVVFLIQEKSCFLSVFDIYFVFDTVLLNLYQCRELRSDESLNQFHSFLLADFYIASFIDTTDVDSVLCENFFNQFYDGFLKTVNSQRKRLYNNHIGKFIYNQTRQEICFSKDQTACAGIYYFFAVFPCIAHALFQKFLINLHILISGHQAHCDF